MRGKKRDRVAPALNAAKANREDDLARLEALSCVTDDEYEARAMGYRYLAGESLAAIARDYGVTAETVRARLLALNLNMRPSGYRDPAFYRQKAEALIQRAEALGLVADCLQGGVVPPRDLLARTTGGG